MQPETGTFRFGPVERVGWTKFAETDQRRRDEQGGSQHYGNHHTGQAEHAHQHITDGDLRRDRIGDLDNDWSQWILHGRILLHRPDVIGLSSADRIAVGGFGRQCERQGGESPDPYPTGAFRVVGAGLFVPGGPGDVKMGPG